MKELIVKEKFHLKVQDILKTEIDFTVVDDFIEYFKEKINNHPVTSFIAVFDHYAHTNSLEQGKIDPSLLAAKNIIFCFGKELESPLVMGLRPRSIGVSELEDKFTIAFQEAPKQLATETMTQWVEALIKQ